jgi:two-component system, LytTR family, response regulator
MKILVVDDEKPSRTKTIRFIHQYRPGCRIEEASDGTAAVETIGRSKPDLMFLDIQMPGMNGFEVIERVGPAGMPPVIFLTAYDEYAVQAFEVHALDYILKPFNFERFKKAFDRVLEIRENASSMDKQIELLLARVNEKERSLDRIMIKDADRITFVNTSDVAYIAAQGKYIQVWTQDKDYLVRKTLQSIQDRLDPNKFFRIHKSHIVNIDHIAALEKWFHGDYNIRLKDGTNLRMSRRYSQVLLSAVE